MKSCLILLFIIYQGVTCHHHHHHSEERLFLTDEQAKAFLRVKRSSDSRCFTHERWCEANMEKCFDEPASEGYCDGSPTTCAAGQECYLKVACPAHYTTGCRDYDECESSPCKNGANCTNGDNNYTCTCLPGYVGADCEIDVDECAGDPCLNGATCNDLVNNYTCDCARNFIENNCETDACHSGPADVTFLLDSSHSQGVEKFNKQLDFISLFTNHFDIGSTEMQVSVITFSFEAKVEFYLNTHSNNISLQKAIRAIQYDDGATYTGSALRAALEDIYLDSTSGIRRFSRKYVILLTDGLASDRSEAFKQSAILRNLGVNVISIGIGSTISHSELLGISGESSNVFTVENTDALSTVMYNLAGTVQSCDNCNRNISDVLFLVDTSISTTAEEFNGNLNSIIYLISIFDIGVNDVRVGIATYADDVNMVFNFQFTYNKDDMYKHVQGILRSHTAVSNTSIALKYAHEDVFTTSNGHRESSRKIVVLLTSGRFSHDDEVIKESYHLISKGIFLVVAAYGKDVNRTSLLNLVSDSHLFFNPGDVYGTESNQILSPVKTLAEFNNCSL